jgi:REP element-mobilizing transposase RayT
MPYSNLLRGRVSINGQICLGRLVVRALHCEATAATAMTLAYVVMPDHLHWLLQLRPGGNLGEAVRFAKGRCAFFRS